MVGAYVGSIDGFDVGPPDGVIVGCDVGLHTGFNDGI
jgi:hypothetical protein